MRGARLPLLVAGIVVVACAAGFWRASSASRSAEHPNDPARAASAEAPAPAAAAAATTEPARTPPAAVPVLSPAQIAELDETRLMARLRSVAETDPALAITLARDGNRRFPGSPDGPERTSILIHALAADGRAMEARGEAEEMVNSAPDSSWVREIERFTGAHRHRNIRINDAGVLVYQ